ncbi:MAG: hypothetical protein UW75_C0003G0005 [Parcubacteria group bacterium GW2011_GWF2_44_8]|nr:MAG: hypothetical protein UW75_C0003G0005 [Parcubacteria group bacterium GW2011_GWF2_44_8]
MNYKILSVVTFIIAVTPAIVFAQTPPPPFRVLVGIPGVDANTASIGQYINALYILSISIAALLAVIKIIIAGVKYMLSDVVTSKADAKSDIQGALIGLLIVISAVVILETINPQLRAMRLFLEPAAQAPGRPVRDTPTQTGTAPLPGRVAGQGDVVTLCTTPETCTAAADTCYQSPNGVVTQGKTSSGTIVTCNYGATNIYNCKQVINSASQLEMADCTAAREQCRTRDPNVVSTATQNGNNEYQISCFTPNKPRPQAGEGRPRGGQ